MNQLPTITAIIPLFNHEDTIKEALDSIVAQNYPNLRFVVIDDASKDNSFKNACDSCTNLRKLQLNNDGEPKELWGGNIGKYQIMLARLGENKGPSTARNYGIRTGAEGTDYYQFLDSDDVLLEGKLWQSVEKMNEFPELIGLVYSDYVCQNIKTGELVREFRPPFVKDNLMSDCLPNMNSLFNKKAFDKVGLFDEEMRVAEDLDMYFRISEYFMISHIPKALVKIRVASDTNSTNRFSPEYWETSRKRIFEKMKNR